MKLITWKELLQIKGTVVYSFLEEDLQDFPDTVRIQYTGESTPCTRLCDEMFPLTIPDYGYCCPDTRSTFKMFIETKEGVVSDLETTGDIATDINPEEKVIIYDKEDISKWITKLQRLDIRY